MSMKMKLFHVSLLAGILVGATFSVKAQETAGQQQEQTSEQGTTDTPGAEEAAASANNAAETDTTESGSAASAAVVTTPTTSGSGSPAVLSRNDGRGRDGTNTVQRATPNMVGSPVENVRVPVTSSEGVEDELSDRQEESRDNEQPADTTATSQTDGN